MQSTVPVEILKKYYHLWLRGATPAQIMKNLNISSSRFNNLTPFFLTYCRHQVKFETRQNLTEKGEPVLIELTEGRKNEFIELISTGLPYNKVAIIMNVPLITVTDYWFKDLHFKNMVDIATETCNAKIVQALYKRGIGYDIEWEEVSTTEGTGEGGQYSTKTKSTKKKHLPGDVNAQKFYLYNRDKDNWSLDGDKATQSGKGKILAYLESLENEVTEEEEQTFEKEQEEFNEKHSKV